ERRTPGTRRSSRDAEDPDGLPPETKRELSYDPPKRPPKGNTFAQKVGRKWASAGGRRARSVERFERRSEGWTAVNPTVAARDNRSRPPRGSARWPSC